MGKWVKLFIILIVVVWVGVFSFPDGKLHVIFCDVGQGDAILAFKGSVQVLIDGGPNSKVLDCLSRYLPFFDRKIEMVVATHPDLDHIGGLPDVLKRYRVIHYVSVPIGKETGAYENLKRLVQLEGSKVGNVYSGDVVKMQGWDLEVVWPEKSWAISHTDTANIVALQDLEKKNVLGARAAGAEPNDFSIGMILRYGQFDLFLTGDADVRIIPEEIATGKLRDIDVLKVPHHGSKTGMSLEWLRIIKPELAVISVGRSNRYGHPTDAALNQLKEIGAQVLRTDVDGDLEIVSDGNRWWVVE